MIRDSIGAIVEATCPACGSTVSSSVGERLVSAGMEWSTSIQCSHCGHAEESRSPGPAPEPYHSALMEQSGKFSVALSENSETSKVLLGLRKALGLPMTETKEQMNKLVGGTMVSTRPTARLIEIILKENGVGAHVVEV